MLMVVVCVYLNLFGFSIVVIEVKSCSRCDEVLLLGRFDFC